MRIRHLITALLIALVAAACGGDGSTDTTDGAATPTTVEETTDTTSATGTTGSDGATSTSGAEAMDGVHVAETDLGRILVDSDGFTLYIFTADTDGVSTCYDDCAASWPAVPGDTPIGSDLDPSIFGTAPRDDGSEQLTVNGMPLYLFTPDTSPGDTNGQGANGVWFVVDETGEMIEASAGDSVLVDYGY